MVFYVIGLCLFSIFDLTEIINKSKPHEKILFFLFFFAALIFGIWYLSAYAQPSFMKIIADIFNIKI